MTALNIKFILQKTAEALTLVADHPALEAAILLAHVLEKPRTYLLAWPEQEISFMQSQTLNELVKRRLNNEPLAYLIGSKEFWSLHFKVTKDTLIPRPETELLVESVLAHYQANTAIKIADLGTGSGAIAISLALTCPTWQVIATDIHPATLAIAKENAQQLAANNISFYGGKWCAALPHNDFTVIVSNPPYLAQDEWEKYAEGLKFEPRMALLAEGNGLSDLQQIIEDAPGYLTDGGMVFLEHGYQQASSVRDSFEQSHYQNITTVRDLAGLERVTYAVFKK